MTGDVAKIDLPYVQTFKDRHGRVRAYYRRKGYPRTALPAPSETGFLAAYEAAGRHEPSEGAGAERTAPGSLSALIVAYYASAEWNALQDSTRRGYRNMLDRFRTKYGDGDVRKITTAHLETIFHKMAATPGAAANLRKRLRRVFRLAVKFGWRADNPVSFTEAPKHKVKGFTPWSEDEIAAYEKHWPTGSRERLAMALLLYTGVRRSDVVTLGRQHIKDGRIQVVPQKTSGTTAVRVSVRIHPSLQREIDAAPPGMTFVLTQFGEPFTAAGFTSWFRERAELAGVMERTPHGLRKAAGRRLAEAGCTAKEIASVLGHASLGEVERYTRSADQTRLADAAMSKLGDAS